MENEPINIHIGDNKDPDIEVKVLGTPLGDIEPIQRTRGIQINSVEDLKEVVEAPLLKCAQILYLKGIPTYESSANKTHLQWGMPIGIGVIVDKLSPENVNVVDELAKGNTSDRGYTVDFVDSAHYSPYQRIAYFHVPVSEDLTLEEIEQRSVDFANHFESNETIKIEVPDASGRDDVMKIDVD